MKPKKILFVVTSADHAGTPDKKTGIWLEEFTTPYYAIVNQGFEVTIASPKGGPAPIDPRSADPKGDISSVKRYYADIAVQDKLHHTLKLEAINPTDFAAVFYPGGHGPMWDLPDNTTSIHLIEAFYQAGKPTAFVCHGPAALENVKGTDGEPWVKGKKVTGYSNSEETIGKTTDVIPFYLEDMLKSKGGIYEKGEDWQPFAVTDGLLITGQNPASANLVAEKLIAALDVPVTAK
jgi:putative intracellular protease/amidase